MTIPGFNSRYRFTWNPPSAEQTVAISYPLVTAPTGDNPIVTVVDSSAVSVLTWGTHYTITGSTDTGFNINFLALALSAYPNPGIVEIKRNTPVNQLEDMAAGGAVVLDNFEKSLDKITIEIQDLKNKVQFFIGVPTYDLPGDGVNLLPNVSNRSNKYLQFDQNGIPTAVSVVTPSGSITPGTVGTVIVQSNTKEEARSASDSALKLGDASQTFLVATPSTDSDAANKAYVASQISAIPALKPKSDNLLTNSWLYINQREKTTYVSTASTVLSTVRMFDRWHCRSTTEKRINIKRDDVMPVGVPPIDNTTTNAPYIFTITPNVSGGLGELQAYTVLSQSIEDRVANSIADEDYITLGFNLRYHHGTDAVTSLIAGGGQSRTLGISIEDSLGNHLALFSTSVTVGDTWEFKSFKFKIKAAAETLNFGGMSGEAGLRLNICINGKGLTGESDGIWKGGGANKYGDSYQFNFSNYGQLIYISNIFIVRGDNTLESGSQFPAETIVDQELKCRRFFQEVTPDITFSATVILLWTDHIHLWCVAKFLPNMAKPGEFVPSDDLPPNAYRMSISKADGFYTPGSALQKPFSELTPVLDFSGVPVISTKKATFQFTFLNSAAATTFVDKLVRFENWVEDASYDKLFVSCEI